MSGFRHTENPAPGAVRGCEVRAMDAEKVYRVLGVFVALHVLLSLTSLVVSIIALCYTMR